MHRGERVCRSVLFWQKTVRRGSRSRTPRPIAVRHGTDAHRPNVGGCPSSAQRSLSPLGDQIPTDSPHRRPTTGGSPTPHRRPDILSAAPLQSSTLQRRSPHLRPPTTGQPSAAARHRHNALPLCHSAPSAAQHRRPPVTDTTPPLPLPQPPPLGSHYPPLGGPSGASPNGRQKRSPSAGRGLNHLSMTNPQRGYLFSFRMRIACSRIVVSSNVTMPPSGPGSK